MPVCPSIQLINGKDMTELHMMQNQVMTSKDAIKVSIRHFESTRNALNMLIQVLEDLNVSGMFSR